MSVRITSRGMRNTACALAAVSALTILAAPVATQAAAARKARAVSKDLRIAVIDVEGGAATIFMTPEGKSLLIDAGWPPGAGGPRPVAGQPTPPPGRSSAEKIAAAASALGIKKFDYFIITHYHGDHIGGLASLMEKMPIDTFIDHGMTSEPPTPAREGPYPGYLKLIAGHPHIIAQTGQTMDIGSMHMTFVSSDAKVLAQPLPGAGQPNESACAGVPGMARDGGVENSHSVSSLITFGKTRIAAFGDLSWNKEIELLCPVNKVGKIDLYFVTQHGMDLSSSPPTVALDPLVAIMANGPLKGGDEAPIRMVNSYPNVKGFWRLHDTIRFPQLNGDPNYIANLNWLPDQNYIFTVAVTPGGDITVANGRNDFHQTYKARAAQ